MKLECGINSIYYIFRILNCKVLAISCRKNFYYISTQNNKGYLRKESEMSIRFNPNNLGAQNTSERDAKLKEYNTLKAKAQRSPQLSPEDQKRLDALEKELKGRNIINDFGQTRGDKSASIFSFLKPELSQNEYLIQEAVNSFIKNNED